MRRCEHDSAGPAGRSSSAQYPITREIDGYLDVYRALTARAVST